MRLKRSPMKRVDSDFHQQPFAAVEDFFKGGRRPEIVPDGLSRRARSSLATTGYPGRARSVTAACRSSNSISASRMSTMRWRSAINVLTCVRSREWSDRLKCPWCFIFLSPIAQFGTPAKCRGGLHRALNNSRAKSQATAISVAMQHEQGEAEDQQHRSPAPTGLRREWPSVRHRGSVA
jgi:hypothetical protein